MQPSRGLISTADWLVITYNPQSWLNRGSLYSVPVCVKGDLPSVMLPFNPELMGVFNTSATANYPATKVMSCSGRRLQYSYVLFG